MLKLIYGTSVPAKTAYLKERISADVDAGHRCFLIVPEQQVYISERDFPKLLAPNAGLYFEILSFSRLCERFFRETGGAEEPSVTTGMRTLLMWETLRRLNGTLSQYGKVRGNDAALSGLMLRTVNELRMNGISPDQLDRSIAELAEREKNGKNTKGSPLLRKLTDLSSVYASFCELSSNLLGADASDLLLRMVKSPETKDYFKGAHFCLDSFSGFTDPEIKVIRKMLSDGADVDVLISLPSPRSRRPHEAALCETVRQLSKAGHSADADLEQIVLPENVETQKPASIRFLESSLWNFSLNPDAGGKEARGADGAVSLLCCRNVYEEAEAAALRILELVQNRSLTYGKIALIVRDTESYRGILDAALERHGIPYFYSERTPLSDKPLARLILSALRCINCGYQISDVLTLLKTGLTASTPREISLFEEYCETWHLSGKRLLEENWNMNPDGLCVERSARGEEILDCALRVRSVVMDPLVRLAASVNAAPPADGDDAPASSHSVRDLCRALFSYLTEMKIPALLSDRAEQELTLGQNRQAGETVRLWNLFTGILCQLCRILPDASMTSEEFMTALSILFSDADLGSVPDIHDCVTVGSADLLRLEEVDAALVLGLVEGEFPLNTADAGILTESDKAVLSSLDRNGLTFASRESTRFSEELFYLSRAFSAPNRFLFLSCPTHKTDGSKCFPSIAFSRVKMLLGLHETLFDLSLLRSMEGKVRPDDDSRFVGATDPNRKNLALTQTKISDFVLCPYRYQYSNVMKLRCAKDSTPDAANKGSFIHDLFERFLSGCLDADGNFSLPDPSEIRPISEELVIRYLDRVAPFGAGELPPTMLHLFRRLHFYAEKMLSDILEELRNSRFVPALFEKKIGMNPERGDFPPVIYTLSDQTEIRLSGKIDRVDFFRSDGKIYVRVVDYKTGKHEFSLDKVQTGEDIQLILYLKAVMDSDPETFRAGEAEYIASGDAGNDYRIVHNGLLLTTPGIPEALDSTEKREFTKSFIEQDENALQELFSQMEETVTEIGSRILSGDARKTPSEAACRFCPLLKHCDRAILPKEGY